MRGRKPDLAALSDRSVETFARMKERNRQPPTTELPKAISTRASFSSTSCARSAHPLQQIGVNFVAPHKNSQAAQYRAQLPMHRLHSTLSPELQIHSSRHQVAKIIDHSSASWLATLPAATLAAAPHFTLFLDRC